METTEYQLIGSIVGAHGLAGELKIFPLTSWPERFLELERIFIEGPTGMVAWTVEAARLHGKKFVLVKVEGIDSRTRAEGMKKCNVHILKSERVPLEEDEYFLDDLIGCAVTSTDGERIGDVVDFHDYGGSGILVVSLAVPRKTLRSVDVPFVDAYIEQIAIAERSVVLRPLWTGLLDMEEA